MLPSDFSFGGDAGALDDQARAREEREAAEFKVPCGWIARLPACQPGRGWGASGAAWQMVPLAKYAGCSSTAGPQACSPEQAQGAQALQIHRPARGGGGRQGMGRQLSRLWLWLRRCRHAGRQLLASGVAMLVADFLWRTREAARAR